ncbi:putative membrane protein [Sinobaca qinghaiensis]|uniref:Putative membrane protein n=1 Tax=Sinobaca qinghaiensis TaxID=342944 RepID=A0A419V963_9BACL|nr:phage holin family protein [Sinobaca qinghaiensis]RKD76550.1 putative membrane protein [Sinobaca qinghaiensis]
MVGCLTPFLINTLTLMAVAGVFNGFYLEGFGAALMAGIILTVVNFFIRPLLVLLTLPFTVVTFGLFIFVINALMLMLTAALMGSSFEISGFGMALLASVIIALLNMVLSNFIADPLSKGSRR